MPSLPAPVEQLKLSFLPVSSCVTFWVLWTYPRRMRLTQQRSQLCLFSARGWLGSLTDIFSSLFSMFSIPLRASPASSLLIFSNSQLLQLLQSSLASILPAECSVLDQLRIYFSPNLWASEHRSEDKGRQSRLQEMQTDQPPASPIC